VCVFFLTARLVSGRLLPVFGTRLFSGANQMTKNILCVVFCVSTAFFGFACSGGGTGTTSSRTDCTPGATQACLGTGACQGAQVCSADGLGWEACQCGSVPNNDGGSSGTDTGTSTSGGPGTDTGTGTSTSGGPGTDTGTSTCVKKTCQTAVPALSTPSSTLSQGAACGFVSDGCGGMLDCGSCTTDGTANTGCGQSAFTNAVIPVPAIPNVCGTRCEISNSWKCSIFNLPSTDGLWYCPSSVPPLGKNNCVLVTGKKMSDYSVMTTPNVWCCDQ